MGMEQAQLQPSTSHPREASERPLRGAQRPSSPPAVPGPADTLPGPQNGSQGSQPRCTRRSHLPTSPYMRPSARAGLPCEHCGGTRCEGYNRHTDGRCLNSPLTGLVICLYHGGRLPLNQKTHKEAKVALMAKKSLFWDPDAPLMDPGDALVSIASRLHDASVRLAERLDDQMADWDERRGQASAACECCGIYPDSEIFDKGLMQAFQFCIKESGVLFTNVEKLGLREREIQLRESQVALLVGALTHMMEAMKATEEQQILGRGALLTKIAELEAKHGADEPIILDAELVEEPVAADWWA